MDPGVREIMGINLKNAVVIFDEVCNHQACGVFARRDNSSPILFRLPQVTRKARADHAMIGASFRLLSFVFFPVHVPAFSVEPTRTHAERVLHKMFALCLMREMFLFGHGC